MITARVAKELGLKLTGYVTSNHAGSTSKVNKYLVNVYLPNTITIPGVTVVEAILSGQTEILIGMDIVSHGDFAFINQDGKSCFSFRIPSKTKIDYVDEGNIMDNSSKIK